MIITREMINKLRDKSEEYRAHNALCNKAFQEIKDRYGKNSIKVVRDGKKVKITENDLWVEMVHNAQTDAKEILAKKYPQIFRLLKDNDLITKEIGQMEVNIIGKPFSQMSADKLIGIIEAIVDLKLQEANVMTFKADAPSA